MAAVKEVADNAVTTLIDRHIAGSRGDKAALKYGDKRYTYNDLAALTNRTGNLLRRLGVEPGAHVLIMVNPSPALLAAVLGAMKIGAIPVLTQTAAADELPETIKAQHLSALVVDAAVKQDAAALAGKAPLLVVGETDSRELSFVNLLRESPSSLSSVAVEGTAPAFKVITGGDIRTFSHNAVSGNEMDDSVEAFATLVRSLRALAGGKEASIPRAQ